MTIAPGAPAFPSPRIVDSRRLTGPNLYSVHPGAVLEVTCDVALAATLLDAWSTHAFAIVGALGWGRAEVNTRRDADGATLFLAAPADVLMTATEVNEQAWTLAEQGRVADRRAVITRLAAMANAERATQPNVVAVLGEAVSRGVLATFDDEVLTIGSGAGSSSWPLRDVPGPRDIAWSAVRDVSIALVTGSNGKTTTTRLVCAMWAASGITPGWCCSDGVWAGAHMIEAGDFSGPAGARIVVRQTTIGAAVLETARGGMLRRGLAVTRADAAIITNLSADHFGEYGVASVRDLAEVKGVVARVLGARGQLVLNADDALLCELAARVRANVSWFSTAPANAAVDAHVRAGGAAATVQEGRAMLRRDGAWHDLGDVNDMPLTLRGAAPHNIANILGAALLASVLGVPVQAIRAALATFGAAADDNPGRLQVYPIGGVTVLIDYAHNPDGLAALCETAKALPSRRRLLLLGQAGNRDDEQIRALARAAWGVTPFDRVIVKEERALLRGRAPGEVPRLLVDELDRLGVRPDDVDVAPSELEALRLAFAWALEGDLLVCPIHIDKAEVRAWLDRLATSGWRVGAPLPD